MRTISHWIDGRAGTAHAERYGAVYDPATGEQTAQVCLALPSDVDAAVTSAAAAFPAWRDSSLSRRVRILFAFRQLVDQHRDELSALITREHGKTLDDALGEVQRGLEVVEFACGIPTLLKGGFSENVSSGVDAYSIQQPLGVVAGITPFNFPAMVPAWMYPVAIACGNCFVLKPSEKDPSAAIRIAELWAEAGLPAGVFTVVQGDKVAVDAILDHPGVAAISFVGSTPVARYVYERCTAAGKRVQALGGAKNHAIVMPDADVASAADALVSAGYGSAGERCMAISAVVAVGDVADRLVEAIRERAARLTTGPGDDPASEMGPLVSSVHRDKVIGYVDAGLHEGATLVADGRDLAADVPANGFFLGPCLFDRVTPEMAIYQEEIFGPVLSVLRVATFDEALILVNESPYGNGVSLFTNDGAVARRFQNEVQVGMVGINIPIPTPMAYYSFGGWKQSLFGDAHVHGEHGVHFYTRTKAVTARWPGTTVQAPMGLSFPTAH